MNKIIKRSSVVILTLLFLVMAPLLQASGAVQKSNTSSAPKKVTDKRITLSQAKALGLKNSDSYEALESKLALAQTKYTQSVKSIKEKRRDKATFRWSPLITLKFPEKLFADEEFQFTFEPIELQANIDTVKHQMNNDKYDVYETVSKLFVEIYTLQEQISYEEEQLEALKETLKKNEARLLAGTATQADIDKINASITSVEDKLSSNKTSFSNKKEKLYKEIGLDVRSGYYFVNPYETAEIDRSKLDGIIKYACDNDETLYEAEVTTNNALTALNINYDILAKKYGGYINLIKAYVTNAKAGVKVDKKAFKADYEKFLTQIDSKWQGKFKILFIKIPKEYRKGSTDGIRYIQDEPYALYENVIEYQDALLEEQQTKDDLESQVKDSYESYVAAKKLYNTAKTNSKNKKEELDKATVLNLAGQLTFDELSNLQDEYSEAQMEELSALSDYNAALIALDKVSCGAITKLLNGENLDMNAVEGGISFVTGGDGAYYFIHSFANDMAFELGVYIPDDFEVEITDFELYINDIQIGEKIPIENTIKHLSLSIDNVESCYIRVYNDEEFICECKIDPTVLSDKLDIIAKYSDGTEGEKKTLAAYTISTDDVLNMISFRISPKRDEIKYFDIQNDTGIFLGGKEKIAVENTMDYLGLVSNDIESFIFNFYDENESLLYKGKIDSQNGVIKEEN